MHRKSVMAFIICAVILSTYLCWAEGPPFPKVLRDMKDHADTVRGQTQELEKLANRLRDLSVEIEELSNRIDYPDQREKIDRLSSKAARFREWVDELQYKTDLLRDLAAKLNREGRILSRKPPKDIGNCGPGKVWIPRQRSPQGQWVPGHCASNY